MLNVKPESEFELGGPGIASARAQEAGMISMPQNGTQRGEAEDTCKVVVGQSLEMPTRLRLQSDGCNMTGC